MLVIQDTKIGNIIYIIIRVSTGKLMDSVQSDGFGSSFALPRTPSLQPCKCRYCGSSERGAASKRAQEIVRDDDLFLSDHHLGLFDIHLTLSDSNLDLSDT